MAKRLERSPVVRTARVRSPRGCTIYRVTCITCVASASSALPAHHPFNLRVTQSDRASPTLPAPAPHPFNLYIIQSDSTSPASPARHQRCQHLTRLNCTSPSLTARHSFILCLTHAALCTIMQCTCVGIITVKLLAEFDFVIIVILLNQISTKLKYYIMIIIVIIIIIMKHLRKITSVNV